MGRGSSGRSHEPLIQACPHVDAVGRASDRTSRSMGSRSSFPPPPVVLTVLEKRPDEGQCKRQANHRQNLTRTVEWSPPVGECDEGVHDLSTLSSRALKRLWKISRSCPSSASRQGGHRASCSRQESYCDDPLSLPMGYACTWSLTVRQFSHNDFIACPQGVAPASRLFGMPARFAAT